MAGGVSLFFHGATILPFTSTTVPMGTSLRANSRTQDDAAESSHGFVGMCGAGDTPVERPAFAVFEATRLLASASVAAPAQTSSRMVDSSQLGWCGFKGERRNTGIVWHPNWHRT